MYVLTLYVITQNCSHALSYDNLSVNQLINLSIDIKRLKFLNDIVLNLISFNLVTQVGT